MVYTILISKNGIAPVKTNEFKTFFDFTIFKFLEHFAG